MSDIINATSYIDPLAQSIREQVSTKSDEFPYLLFPVKIETRFMEVDRPVDDEPDLYAEVLDSLFALQEYLRFDPARLPDREVLGRMKKLPGMVDELTVKIDGIQRLSNKDKDRLAFELVAVEKSAQQLSVQLSQLRWTDTAKLRKLMIYRKALSTSLRKTREKIDALKTSDRALFLEGDTFLNAIEEMNESLIDIGKKDLSSKDRREKRSSFVYLDKQFSSTDRAIRNIESCMNVSMRGSPSQIQKLDALQEVQAELLTGAGKNIDKIKSDYKKAEYRAKLERVAAKIGRLQKDIKRRARPKMIMMYDLKTASARDVLWQINKIRYRLKRINERPFRVYDELRNVRQSLYRQLDALSTTADKIIEGNGRELRAIGSAWDDADAELERFTQRVKSFKGLKGQKSAISRTVNYINESYRKDLQGLKSSSKSCFAELNNSSLEKSAITYVESRDALQEIWEGIRNNRDNPRSGRLEAALRKLIDLRGQFEARSRGIHVLPDAALGELNRIASKIGNEIGALVASANEGAERARTGRTLDAAAEAAAAVRSIARNQFSDTAERRARLVEEDRAGFVFARNTVTRNELWVRIYPDDIAIHTHEEALTAEEAEAGKAYWHEIWAANDDYDTKLAAWRAISTAYGSQRAAWIVKSLEPEESATGDVRLGRNSKVTEVNDLLQRIVGLIANGKEPADQVIAMGEAYPLLVQVEKSMTSIVADHANLLLKTQRLLLKLQSIVDGAIRPIPGMPPEERLRIAPGREVVTQFALSFNRITEYFQKIGRLSSREIIASEADLVEFPEVEIKEDSWTVAPHSNVMPDRFVVVTVREGEYKHVVVGKPLPADRLIVGLDPSTFETDGFAYDEDGNLIVDESIKWLTDFDEAEEKGMAVHITLGEQDLAGGFDKVFVVGVKDSTAQEGKQLLEKLLENHHYIPEGASFLPIGTPTNNTEAGASGYRTFEEDAALSFAIERNNEDATTSTPVVDWTTDAERLAEGLGIDVDVLDNLDYHDRTEISEALLLNKALFHGTLGNYMEEGLDTLFTLDAIDRTRAFFCDYVSGRGFLPALRVGTQPYGILPTTAFSWFHATQDDSDIPTLNKEDFERPQLIESELQTRYDIRLKTLLNLLDDLWTAIRIDKVPSAENTDPADPQAHFMQMLGLHANSVEFLYRYGLNVASRHAANVPGGFKIGFNSTDAWSPASVADVFRGFVFSGYYYLSDDFADEQTEITNVKDYSYSKNNRINNQVDEARVFTMRHLMDQSQVLGHVVDGREPAADIVAATDPNAGNAEEQAKARAELGYFIDWLTDNNPWDVHAENKYSEVVDGALTEGMPSKSLLFQLLRHSVLSAYADTILKILEYEGLTDQKTRKKMGRPDYFYTRVASSLNYVTKWTYLFSKINRLDNVLGYDMDAGNSFYTYMSSLSGSNNGYLNRYLSPEHTFVFNNYTNHNQHQAFIDELDTTRDAIRELKNIPTSRLQQLLAEHIDLCTYRLDAWRLGMVNKRLQTQRAANPTGVYLGAYGWLEDLRKGGDRDLAQNIPDGLWKTGDDPVYTDADNLGFIHSPSLNHAITAAILRAGFHANEDTAEVDNQMAVNLSSGRVRVGLNLLNGIRGGQDAAALLGYQFERGLHERYLHVPLELDEYIYDFRDEFPLSVPVDDSVSLGEAALTNVVDGIELLETAQEFIESQGGPPHSGDSIYQSLKAFESAWWSNVGNSNISAAGAEARDAMLKEIDRIADAFDALADLCLSDSVYQVVRGNHVRASAIMDKLARGDVPNDIEIADTPRTGTVVTHKAGLFFAVISGIDHELTESGDTSTPVAGSALEAAVVAAGARPAGWSGAFTPRAIAEPTLNKWVGDQIGDPGKIKCLVGFTVAESTAEMTVTLADLEIQPLDAMHLFGSGPLDGSAELNARIANKVKDSITLPVGFEGTVDDALIHIRFTRRDTGWSNLDYSFYEKAGYIQSIRTLIAQSAALAADGLLIPGEEELEVNAVKNQEVDEYLIRITNLKARLVEVQDDWETFFADEISLEDVEGHSFTDAQIDQMRALLTASSLFGIPGTLPDETATYGDAAGFTLLGASDGAAKAIGKRLKETAGDMELAKDATRTNDARIDAIRQVSRKLLGRDCVLLPHFKLRNGAELADQLAVSQDRGLLRAAQASAMDVWSNGVARVRERMAGLETMDMWAENFDTALPEKKPLQLPFALDETGVAVDHWLGLAFPTGYSPNEDKLSLVLLNSAEMTTAHDAAKAAILVDEWVEIIPNLEETTGVAFQYDQPDAKPPNNLLLVVTPRETGQWQWDNLVYALGDTLKMAKNRAVEPEHLDDTVFGQIMPALMYEVVPPQLLPDSADDSSDAQDNPLGLQVVTDFGVVNETIEPESG